jgi:hypothetical protein
VALQQQMRLVSGTASSRNADLNGMWTCRNDSQWTHVAHEH